MAIGIRSLQLTCVLSCLLGIGCKRSGRSFVSGTAYLSAEAALQRGDLNKALSETDNALSKTDKNDIDSIWRFRLLKSEILIWQGQSQESLALLGSGDASEPNNLELRARRNTLKGTAESNLQLLSLAAETFSQTEAMPGSRSPQVKVDLALGEGKLAAFQHDPVKSEQLFRSAFTMAQSNGQAFNASKALGNLGMLEMSQDRYADAVDFFDSSLVTARRINAYSLIVRTTGNLGWAYLQMGDLDRALQLFEESEKESGRLGMLADQKTALMSIASIRFSQSDFINAEHYYQQSLTLADKLGDKREMAFGLIDLAQVAIAKRDYRLAEIYNRRSLEIESETNDQDTELYSLVNEAQIDAWKHDDQPAELCLLRVIQNSKTNLILKARALSALAKLDRQQNRTRAASRHFQEAIASLETGRGLLGREEYKLSYPTNEKSIYDDYIDFLVDSKLPDEAFRVAETHKARTLTEGFTSGTGSHPPMVDVDKAKKATGQSGHAILSYWLGQERSYLWFFQSGKSFFCVLPGENQIRSRVISYTAHLTGAFGSADATDEYGKQLYRLLIGPVASSIRPQSRVTIIPDEDLCGLNFETLIVDSKVPHYWIEDVSVKTASSATFLAGSNRFQKYLSDQVTMKLLLIGNPLPLANYPLLAHADEEIGFVKSHFPQDQESVLSGEQASPSAYFKANPEHFAFIHFVAHGRADRASPLSSAILLSGSGSSPNLYARDIATRKVHASLVTISACDSAGTRIYSSEGLVGLSWAFLRAGAHNVIASLWEVDDTSTPRLMDSLYSAIAAGKDPEFALRAAKLSMLHSQTVFRRPYYWAPFVLYEGAT